MASAVLVINCGSSSLKYAAIEPKSGAVLSQGLAERLGRKEAVLRVKGAQPKPLSAHAGPREVLAEILPSLGGTELVAVGHRVVHGGEAFADSVLLDERSISTIRDCEKLAPLHNPANLAGIEAARAEFPELPHVAVFDTAFHQSLPPKAFHYALPRELYERYQVRRYGFHGSSHQYVASEAARLLGKPLESLELITAHLGNGCSTCAIRAGKSVDTSMGLTPLEGLVMGTRSGDVDPSLHLFIAEATGRSLQQVTDLLTRESGLIGLSGLSNDMRTLLEAAPSNPRAELAIEIFCYRLAKSILGMSAPLTRVDALIFTGGIGEHAAPVRARTLEQLGVLRAEVDLALNDTHGAGENGRITSQSSGLLALVVPTNEELVIARETARLAPRKAPRLPERA